MYSTYGDKEDHRQLYSHKTYTERTETNTGKPCGLGKNVEAKVDCATKGENRVDGDSTCSCSNGKFKGTKTDAGERGIKCSCDQKRGSTCPTNTATAMVNCEQTHYHRCEPDVEGYPGYSASSSLYEFKMNINYDGMDMLEGDRKPYYSGTLADLANLCEQRPECVGFNTAGEAKTDLGSFDDSYYPHAGCAGFYMKIG
jgi:hypothetical protein